MDFYNNYNRGIREQLELEGFNDHFSRHDFQTKYVDSNSKTPVPNNYSLPVFKGNYTEHKRIIFSSSLCIATILTISQLI